MVSAENLQSLKQGSMEGRCNSQKEDPGSGDGYTAFLASLMNKSVAVLEHPVLGEESSSYQ
jgi:hypothetical protein